MLNDNGLNGKDETVVIGSIDMTWSKVFAIIHTKTRTLVSTIVEQALCSNQI